MRKILFILTIGCIALRCHAADAPRLVRSISGPSGKIVGSDFVFDETRNRFVFPADKSLTIYFQWETTPGEYVLTAIWKRPDGVVASISPDVKIETKTPTLNCYWISALYPGMANGVWTLEIRLDGRSIGSHPFEIAGMTVETDTLSVPKQLTLDDIYKTHLRSLVWIRKLDGSGRRFDSATGFVFRPNVIATAFQAIDSATQLEIEFSDGRKIQTDEVIAFSRNADWALLKADTGLVGSIPRGDTEMVGVGEHLAAFNFDAGVRVLGAVDIGGNGNVPSFGRRIQISPSVAQEAVGGPLIDARGAAVGILGGSTNPGARIARNSSSVSPGLWRLLAIGNAATAISEVPNQPPQDIRTLARLATEGSLTAALVPMPEFSYGGTTGRLPKSASSPMPTDLSEFSRRDPEVSVYSMWTRKGKLGKGELSMVMYDPTNRPVFTTPPKKISLSDVTQRFATVFSPSSLQPGIYRIDLNWDGRPAWRTFIQITE